MDTFFRYPTLSSKATDSNAQDIFVLCKISIISERHCSMFKGASSVGPAVIEIDIDIEIGKLPEIDFDHDFDFDSERP
jgi:hypothetical protein